MLKLSLNEYEKSTDNSIQRAIDKGGPKRYIVSGFILPNSVWKLKNLLQIMDYGFKGRGGKSNAKAQRFSFMSANCKFSVHFFLFGRSA
jgi:hypothetical protein